jgi:hypothetical protein
MGTKGWTGIKINGRTEMVSVDLFILRLFNDSISTVYVIKRQMVGNC